MSRQWNSEAICEMDDDINVQFKPEQFNFLDGMWIQRYQNTLRDEEPKMSSITNKETLEHESDKHLEKGIKNTTDEKALRKESD